MLVVGAVPVRDPRPCLGWGDLSPDSLPLSCLVTLHAPSRPELWPKLFIHRTLPCSLPPQHFAHPSWGLSGLPSPGNTPSGSLGGWGWGARAGGRTPACASCCHRDSGTAGQRSTGRVDSSSRKPTLLPCGVQPVPCHPHPAPGPRAGNEHLCTGHLTLSFPTRDGRLLLPACWVFPTTSGAGTCPWALRGAPSLAGVGTS